LRLLNSLSKQHGLRMLAVQTRFSLGYIIILKSLFTDTSKADFIHSALTENGTFRVVAYK